MTSPSSNPAATEPSAAAFAPLQAGAASQGAAPLDTLMDISVNVSIQFGRTRMTVQDVLGLGTGSLIQLDRMVGEPVDIFVSDQKFGEGEVVVIGEHFGVRVTRIVNRMSVDRSEA